MSGHFKLADAAEISVAPYLARAAAREAVRLAAHAREAAAAAGTSLHVPPCAPNAPENLEADGIAAFERARLFAGSPRGRYLAALQALADLHPNCCEAALASYARGLASAVTSITEIGRALSALGGIEGRAAHTACRALSDLLVEALGLAD